MIVKGTCDNCKTGNASIEVEAVDAENHFRGHCVKCNADIHGGLFLRVPNEEKEREARAAEHRH